MTSNKQELTGQKFGRLTATKYITYRRWACNCDCGKKVTVNTQNLTNGMTKSCGCLRQEQATLNATKHGHGNGTREYTAWQAMKTRCTNPNSIGYQYWGGKGISIFPPWIDSFSNFFAYIGKCPDGYVLDRIDPDGNYEPGNVRWATILEQANNKTNTIRYEYQGRSLSPREWDRETGNKLGTFRRRHVINGWDIKRAITQPVRKITKATD